MLIHLSNRNNHLKQHRQQLRDAVAGRSPPVRLLALNWSFDLPLSTIHRLCGERIVRRGGNHQSLVPDAADAAKHEDVLWQFLKGTEDLSPDEVNEAVEMDVEESLEDALTRAVDACVRILGVPRPDQESMGQALAAARGYAPKTIAKPPAPKEDKATERGGSKKSQAAPRYFGILAEVDLETALAHAFDAADAHKSGAEFFDRLKKGGRVANRPHVTIVHSKGVSEPQEKAVWDRCAAATAGPRAPMFSFRLGHLLWNDRIMAATVDSLAASTDNGGAPAEAVEFVGTLPVEVRERLHVTVGTRDASVPPVEAKDLVGLWKKNGGNDSAEARSVALPDVLVKGLLKGLHS